MQCINSFFHCAFFFFALAEQVFGRDAAPLAAAAAAAAAIPAMHMYLMTHNE